MEFNRRKLHQSAVSLASSGEKHDSCIGCNYLIEENISERRRDEMESFEPLSEDVREVVDSYFKDSIQGLARGHKSSTFDESTNDLALLSATVEPIQKIIRLERIDRLVEPNGGLDYKSLVDAVYRRDQHRLTAFTDMFLDYPGERPSFAAFRSEVATDLAEADWTQRLIDRLGLYHHYPYIPNRPNRFALMEYTAQEVIEQARAKGIGRCFSLATVLECQNNPAFFPVPLSTNHGFTVDLRERNPKKPSVREILHIRFDYSWKHVKRLAEWSGADVPDIQSARVRHLGTLRAETGRTDFGDIRV